MKKKEFMEELKEALAGRVPAEVYDDTVKYYEDYFKSQIAEGKSEEQVAASLGSGRIIAKTIIETSKGSGEKQFYEMPDEKKKKADKRNEERKQYQKGWHLNVDENGYTSLAFGRLDFGTPIGKLVAVSLFVILLIIILTLIAGLIYIAVPVAVVLLIIYVIVSTINRS